MRLPQFKLRLSSSSCYRICKGIISICSPLLLRGHAIIHKLPLALDFADCLASLTEPFPSMERACLLRSLCSKGSSPVFHQAERLAEYLEM